MRLLELAFKWGGRPYRVGLTGSHHSIVAPPEFPLRALRDGVCAAFYGVAEFPGAVSAGLQHAGLAFEVGGQRHRLLVDLTTGRRVLVRETSAPPEVVADQPGPLGQLLAAWFHLPGPAVYRALVLADRPFPDPRLPRIPPGAQRGLLAHARTPDHLRGELQRALQKVDAARLQARRGDARAPWTSPWVVVPGLAGVLSLGAAAWAPGAARMAGLGAPFFFGAVAWRALQWVDATDARSRGLRSLDDAESVARARKRHLDELEQALDALERAVGSRSPETVAAALEAMADVPPSAELQESVAVYAGTSPTAADAAERATALGVAGAASASAGLVLAGLRARGGEAVPLVWMAEGAEGITWDRVFESLTAATPLLVFCHRARAVDRPVALESPRA